MIRQHFIIFAVIVGGLTAMLSGCFGTSPPTRFYTLSPPDPRLRHFFKMF